MKRTEHIRQMHKNKKHPLTSINPTGDKPVFDFQRRFPLGLFKLSVDHE